MVTGALWTLAAVVTHGYTSGVVKVDVGSRFVPESGIGAPFDTEVTAGAETTAEESPPDPDELIVPPSDLILCQLPLISP